MMEHIPTRQRSAKAQAEAGVLIPYFHPAERDHLPVTYHLTMVKLPTFVLNRLVVAARVHAASKEHLRHPNDNRKGLGYPATPREKVNFCRHSLLNRRDKQNHMLNGYANSYDQLLSKIARKGVDVAERQLELKLAVLRLIASTYPELTLECEEQIFQSIHNHKEQQQ